MSFPEELRTLVQQQTTDPDALLLFAQKVIETFVEATHEAVKEDMMGGNPFHRQMER